MVKLARDKELDTVDIVTNTMFSLSFLDQITSVIFSENRHKITVGQFYDQWLVWTNASEPKVPFNPGIFTAYMYCGLLVTKENWYDLVPNLELAKLDPDWGLAGVICHAPKHPKVTLPYFIRRIRNALGHAHFSFAMPDDIKVNEIHARAEISFRDQNRNDPADFFETSLTWNQIERLIRQFHSVVYPSVKAKHGI
jgi:HEPN family protein